VNERLELIGSRLHTGMMQMAAYRKRPNDSLAVRIRIARSLMLLSALIAEQAHAILLEAEIATGGSGDDGD
jgi:hypothetical protein